MRFMISLRKVKLVRRMNDITVTSLCTKFIDVIHAISHAYLRAVLLKACSWQTEHVSPRAEQK